MAKITRHKPTIFFNLVSMLFFVLIVSMVESRVIGTFPKANPRLVCDRVVGVKSADTRVVSAEWFNLTIGFFRFINPNLNCEDLFVGQWLCVAGKST